MARPRALSSVYAALMSERLPGYEQRRADALHGAGAMRTLGDGASRARRRREARTRHAHEKTAPPPEAIAERAADEHQRREQQQRTPRRPTARGRRRSPSSRWMTGSATLTTLPSRNAMLEPRMAVTSAHVGVPWRGPRGELEVTAVRSPRRMIRSAGHARAVRPRCDDGLRRRRGGRWRLRRPRLAGGPRRRGRRLDGLGGRRGLGRRRGRPRARWRHGHRSRGGRGH